MFDIVSPILVNLYTLKAYSLKLNYSKHELEGPSYKILKYTDIVDTSVKL